MAAVHRKYSTLAAEMVRALRGRRSQAALSRRLGYSTNAIYTWESRRAWPTIARFFEFTRVVGVDPNAAVARFFGRAGAPAAGTDPAGVRTILQDLLGRTPIGVLSRTSGINRYTLSRWLGGKALPKLPEFLCYLEHTSLRLLDFVDAFIDPALLRSVRRRWEVIQGARSAGYEMPMTQAVLHAVELERYRTLPRHRAGVIAASLGIDSGAEDECLKTLARLGQIRKRKGRWEPVRVELVDFRRDPESGQRIKAFWAGVAAERARTRRPGLFAYNVFAVSRTDLARLEALQREYLRSFRTIVAESQPSEIVALANFQLFALED